VLPDNNHNLLIVCAISGELLLPGTNIGVEIFELTSYANTPPPKEPTVTNVLQADKTTIVGVGVEVTVGVAVKVLVNVGVCVNVGVLVNVLVNVCVGVRVFVGVCVGVGVKVLVGVFVTLTVGVLV
jgi:hypothetical protein